MTYNEAARRLGDFGLRITSKGIVDATTGKRASDIQRVLNSIHMTESELVTLYKAEQKRTETEKTPFSVFDESYCYITMINPELDSVPKFNEIDRRSLGRKIAFAFNPTDDSPLLCVHIEGNKWNMVPFGNGRSANMASVFSAFKKSAPVKVDGPYRNFAEELEALSTVPLDIAVKMANAGKFESADDMCRFIAEHASGFMINHTRIKVLTCKVIVEPADEDSKPFAVFVPKKAKFVKGDSTASYGMVECLVDNYPALAAIPELTTRVPTILSNDPEEPTLNYIDLDEICKDMPTPAWDEFSARFTEDEYNAFKAYIWSCFKAKNTSRQMLYIYDPDGFSGKSVVLSVVAKHLGEHLCTSLQKDSLNNQFSLAKVWDKRLVTIDDNKNPMLLRSEKVHMMLGGGRADIEMKGKNSFSFRLRNKIIAAGNTQLQIDPYADHERSRLIVIRPKVTDEMKARYCVTDSDGKLKLRNGKPILKGDPNFESNLDKEFPGFMSQCREAYARLCPTDANIIISDEMNDGLFALSTTQDDIFDLVLRSFIVDPSVQCQPSDFIRTFNSALKGVALDCNLKEGKLEYSMDDFYTYLTKRFSFVKRRKPHRGGRVYIGVAPAPDEPENFHNLGVTNESAS